MCILLKNQFHSISYWKQINIFKEMVICLAAGCKSDTRQGKD